MSERKNEIHFITCIFGDNYVPMLIAFLESLSSVHANDRITVGWSSIQNSEVELLKLSYPSVEFIEISDLGISQEILINVSLKLEFFKRITKNIADGLVALIDCDMIVREELFRLMPTEPFDIVYTWKTGKWSLNAGVIFLNLSKKTRFFIEWWSCRTAELLHSTESMLAVYKIAGSADQYAFLELFNFQLGRSSKQVIIADQSFYFFGMPCSSLNETRSVPLSSNAAIFHYKGGWHPILLKHQPYSIHRPRKKCLAMKTYWESYYSSGLKRIMEVCCNASINSTTTVFANREVVLNKVTSYKDIFKAVNSTKHIGRIIVKSNLLNLVKIIKILKPERGFVKIPNNSLVVELNKLERLEADLLECNPYSELVLLPTSRDLFLWQNGLINTFLGNFKVSIRRTADIFLNVASSMIEYKVTILRSK